MFPQIAMTNTLAATLTAALAVCWAVKTAAAQSGTPSAAPLAPVTAGGGLIGTVPLPQSRPVRRSKTERTDEAASDQNVISSPPNLPVANNRPAREYSPQEVRFKLQALDRQAAQGLLSLEEYRELQQRILLGR